MSFDRWPRTVSDMVTSTSSSGPAAAGAVESGAPPTDASVREPDAVVPRWVRVAIVAVLAAPQLATGLWAVLAPSNWYETFPGIGPSIIAADPPFNHHLATDAGAGFLATGVALLAAAIIGRRSGVYVALVGYLTFAIPHLAFHVAHPATTLSTAENTTNVFMLGSGVAATILIAAGARSAGENRAGRDPRPGS